MGVRGIENLIKFIVSEQLIDPGKTMKEIIMDKITAPQELVNDHSLSKEKILLCTDLDRISDKNKSRGRNSLLKYYSESAIKKKPAGNLKVEDMIKEL